MKQNNITANTINVFSARMIMYVLAFVASIFLTRLLGAEGKGIVAFAFANADLLGMLLGLNVVSPLTYFLSKKETNQNSIFTIVIAVNSISILLFVFLGFLLLWFGSEDLQLLFFPKGYKNNVFIALLTLLFINKIVGDTFCGFLQGNMQFGIINKITIFHEAVALICYGAAFIYVGYTKDYNLELIFWLIFLVYSVSILVKLIIIILTFNTKLNFCIKKKIIRSFFNYAKIGYFTGLMHFVIQRIDLWFVEYYHTIQEIGYYSLAVALTNNLLVASLLPAVQVMSPYITQSTKSEGIQILGRFTRILTTVSILMTIIAIVFFPYIIPLLYGAVFTSTILPFQILCLGIFFTLLKSAFAIYNDSVDNQKPNLYANLFALIITIILDFLWIPKYGIIGASWASIIAYALSGSCVFYSIYKEFSYKMSFYFLLTREDSRFLFNKANTILSRYI